MPSVPLLAAGIAFAGLTGAPLAAQSVVLLDTAVLAAPRLAEASGLAASRRHRGIYWVHNDSGDGPVLYATDSTGADLGRVRVAHAGAVDWEDIALGPCVVVPGACLYIGDTGDNLAERRSVTIYRLREPDPPRSADDTLRVAPLLDSLVVRYPDGPHNVETIAVTPDGVLLLVTKNRSDSPQAFRADLSRRPLRVRSTGPLAVATGVLRGRMVTGGAVSPDGRMLMLRTYVSLHPFRVLPDGALVPLTPPDGLRIPVVESQGEGIDFDGRGRLVLVSERGVGGHAMISRLGYTLQEPARP